MSITSLACYRHDEWEPLPYRFHRLDADTVLVTNMVGEHLVLTTHQFDALSRHGDMEPDVLSRLLGRHIVRRPNDELALELLAMKLRTRMRRLPGFTALHLFVVTLRCDHSCRYCQVSRQGSRRHEYDMTEDTARAALDLVFASPSPTLKIEFQGGEPLLNFDLIRFVVEEAELRNQTAGRELAFVITTNLALLDDDVLAFCRAHRVFLSTSLDGPRDLHNTNRPRPGGDSWERTVTGIRSIQDELGVDWVAALMTTTEASFGRVREIIDTYRSLGLRDVFLRPLSPYGFAVRNRVHAAYDTQRWLAFYEEGLDYIIELNQAGHPIVEQYAALVLNKMLTNDDPGYVDLTSPAGIGIGALVYNYDGDVYASDEARMLAEIGDTSFRLGNVHTDSHIDLVTADALLDPLEASFAASAPMCNDCAFEPFCGADPVYHHTLFGDPLGRKPSSGFCQRNMGVFRLLLDRYHRNPDTRHLFHRWANR
jgi:His-Xaa-Ser system radical SAM maturase HxsB